MLRHLFRPSRRVLKNEVTRLRDENIELDDQVQHVKAQLRSTEQRAHRAERRVEELTNKLLEARKERDETHKAAISLGQRLEAVQNVLDYGQCEEPDIGCQQCKR